MPYFSFKLRNISHANFFSFFSPTGSQEANCSFHSLTFTGKTNIIYHHPSFFSSFCFLGLQALEISDSDDVQITSLNFKDNPKMHLVLNNLRSVSVSTIHIDAPADSKNTDGIHVTGSTDVSIDSCKISTGIFFSFLFFFPIYIYMCFRILGSKVNSTLHPSTISKFSSLVYKL